MKYATFFIVLFTLQTFAQLNGTKKEAFFILTEFKVKDVRTNGIDYTKKALEGENNLFFIKIMEPMKYYFLIIGKIQFLKAMDQFII